MDILRQTIARTEEFQFLEPKVVSRYLVKHCNFTLDFSSSPIFRINFLVPRRFVKSEFHCISLYFVEVYDPP